MPNDAVQGGAGGKTCVSKYKYECVFGGILKNRYPRSKTGGRITWKENGEVDQGTEHRA